MLTGARRYGLAGAFLVLHLSVHFRLGPASSPGIIRADGYKSRIFEERENSAALRKVT